MAHAMILGMTISGKTSLAKSLARSLRAKGIQVLAFDPTNDPEWINSADFVTADRVQFLQVYWQSEGCAVFIDEAADVCTQADKDFIRTATQGRHRGHQNFYIAQRGTMIARTIRDQCTRLYIFTTALADAKIHSDEWNAPQLLESPALPRGTFFYVDKYGRFERRRLF